MKKDCNTCAHGYEPINVPPCEGCKNFDHWVEECFPDERPQSALDVQVAGDHYKGKGIQPVEYISANNLTFLEGCIVKRITRWRDKQSGDKFDDLNKIKHEVDLLIEMEKKYGG